MYTRKKIYDVSNAKECKKIQKSIQPFSITLFNYSNDVEDNLFEGCDTLENVIGTFDTKSIGKRSFAHCQNLVRFDAAIKDIGEEAFSFCNSLKDFNFSNLCRLSNKSFQFSGIETIDFPSTLSVIPEGCFNSCVSLKHVFLNKVSIIEKEAFANCMSLSYVILENSLKEIKQKAFKDCFMLKTLYCSSTTPPKIYSNTFSGCFINKIIVENKIALENFSRAPYWNKYKSCIAVKS